MPAHDAHGGGPCPAAHQRRAPVPLLAAAQPNPPLPTGKHLQAVKPDAWHQPCRPRRGHIDSRLDGVIGGHVPQNWLQMLHLLLLSTVQVPCFRRSSIIMVSHTTTAFCTSAMTSLIRADQAFVANHHQMCLEHAAGRRRPGGTCEGQVTQELNLLAHDLRLGDVVDVDHLGRQPAWQGPVRAIVCQQDAHVQRGEEQPLAVRSLVEVVLVRLQEGCLVQRARPCAYLAPIRMPTNIDRQGPLGSAYQPADAALLPMYPQLRDVVGCS